MRVLRNNIGLLIEQRLNEVRMNKAQFAKNIGIANQNVNRLLSRESIDTDKLVDISETLDYNFFEAFQTISESNADATTGGVAIAGNATAHHFTTNACTDTAALQEQIKLLKQIIDEKERLISILLNKQ